MQRQMRGTRAQMIRGTRAKVIRGTRAQSVRETRAQMDLASYPIDRLSQKTAF